jgi:hypothetical protein
MALSLCMFKEGAGSGFHQFANACHMKQRCFLLYIEVLLVKLKALHPECFLSGHLHCKDCYCTLYLLTCRTSESHTDSDLVSEGPALLFLLF